MEIELVVNCVECGEEIIGCMIDLSEEERPQVNVTVFAQSEWECHECGAVTCIGDIDMCNREDL